MSGSSRNYAIVSGRNSYDEKCIFPSARSFYNKDATYHSVIASFLGLLIWATAMACSKDLSGATALEQIRDTSQKCQPKSKKSEIAASVNNYPKDSLNDSLRVSNDDRQVSHVVCSAPKTLVDSTSNKTEFHCHLVSDAKTRNVSLSLGESSNVDKRVHEQKGTFVTSERNEDCVFEKYRFLKSELAKIDALDSETADVSKSGHKEARSPILRNEKSTVSISSSSASTKLDSISDSFAVACRNTGHCTKTQRPRVTVSIPIPGNEVITVDYCRSEIDEDITEVHKSHAEPDKILNDTHAQREEKELGPPKSPEGEQCSSSSDIKSPKMSKMFQILINLDKTERERKSNPKKTFSQSDANTEQKLSGKNRLEPEKDGVPAKSKPLSSVIRHIPNNANHQNSWWDHKSKYNSCNRDFEWRRRHRYSPMESRQPSSSRESSADRNLNRYQTQGSLNSDQNQNRQNHWSEKSRQLVADFLKGLNESEHRAFTSKGSPPNNHPSRFARGYPTKTSRQTTRSLPDRKRPLTSDRYFDPRKNSVQFRNGNDVQRQSGTSTVRELRFAENTRRPSDERNPGFDRLSNNTRCQWPKREMDPKKCHPRSYSPDTFSRGSTETENCNLKRKLSFNSEECSKILRTDGRCRSKSLDQSLFDNSIAANTLRKKHQSSPNLDTLEVSSTKSYFDESKKSPYIGQHQSAVAHYSKSEVLQKLDNKSQHILTDIESESDQSGENSYPNLVLQNEHDEKEIFDGCKKKCPTSSVDNQSAQTDNNTQDETIKGARSNSKNSTEEAKTSQDTCYIKDINCSQEHIGDTVTASEDAILVGSNHPKKEMILSNDLALQQNQKQKMKNEIAIDKPLNSFLSISLTKDLSEACKKYKCESREKIKYPQAKAPQCTVRNKTAEPPNDNTMSNTNGECIETQSEKDQRQPKKIDNASEHRNMKDQLIDKTNDTINRFSQKAKQNSNPRKDSSGIVPRTHENKCSSTNFEDPQSTETLISANSSRNAVLPDKHEHVIKTTDGNSSVGNSMGPEIISNPSSEQSSNIKSNEDRRMNKYKMICRKFLSSIHAESGSAENQSNTDDKCSAVEEPCPAKHDDSIEAIDNEKEAKKHSDDKVILMKNNDDCVASTSITENNNDDVASTSILEIKKSQKVNCAKSLEHKDDKITVTERCVKNSGVNVLASSATGIPRNLKRAKLPCIFIKNSLSTRSHDRYLPKELRTCIQRVVSPVELKTLEIKQVEIERKEYSKIKTNPKSSSQLVVPSADDGNSPQIIARKNPFSKPEADTPRIGEVNRNNVSTPSATSSSCVTKLSDSNKPSSSLKGDKQEGTNKIEIAPSLLNLKNSDPAPTKSRKIKLLRKNTVEKSAVVGQSAEKIAKKSNSSDAHISFPTKNTKIKCKEDSLEKRQNTEDLKEIAPDANLAKLSDESTEKNKEDPIVEGRKPSKNYNKKFICTPGAQQVEVVTAKPVPLSSELDASYLALASEESEISLDCLNEKQMDERDLISEISNESTLENQVDEREKDLVTEKFTDESNMEMGISHDNNMDEKAVGPKYSNKSDDGKLVFECPESASEQSTKDYNTEKDSCLEFSSTICSKPNVEDVPVKLGVDVEERLVVHSSPSESNVVCQNLHLNPSSSESKTPVDVLSPLGNDTLQSCDISEANVDHCNENTTSHSNITTEKDEKIPIINKSHLENRIQHPEEQNVETTLCNDGNASSECKLTELEQESKTSTDQSNVSECVVVNKSNPVTQSGTETLDNSTLDTDLNVKVIENDSVLDHVPFLTTSTTAPLPIDDVDEPESDYIKSISEEPRSPRDNGPPKETCDEVKDSSSSLATSVKGDECVNSTDLSKDQLDHIADSVEVPAASSEPGVRVDNQSLEDHNGSHLTDSCLLISLEKTDEDSVEISKPETKCATEANDDGSTLGEDSVDIHARMLETAEDTSQNESSELGILSESDPSSQGLEPYDNSGIVNAECEKKSCDVDSNDIIKKSSQPESSFEITESSVDNCLIGTENAASSAEIENCSTVILPEEYISEVSESIEPHQASLAVLPVDANHEFGNGTNSVDEIGNSETALTADSLACDDSRLVEESETKEDLSSEAAESSMHITSRSIAPATFPEFVPNCDIAFFSDPESNFADNNDNYFSPACDYSSEVTIYSSEVEESHTDPTAIVPTESKENEVLLTCPTNEENNKGKKKINRSKPESEKRKVAKAIKKLQKPRENVSLDSRMKSKMKEEPCSPAETVNIKNIVSETHAEQDVKVQIAAKQEDETLDKSQHKNSTTGDSTSDVISKTQHTGTEIKNPGTKIHSDEEKIKTELVSGCKRPRRERRAHISKSFIDHDTPSEDDSLLEPYIHIEPKRMSKKERGLSKSKHSRKIKSITKNVKKRDDPLSVYDLSDYSDEGDVPDFNSSSYLTKYRKPMPKIRKYLLRSDQRHRETFKDVSASVDQNAGNKNPAVPLVRLEESLNDRTSHFLQSRGYIPVETRHADDTDEGSNGEADSKRLVKKRIENSSSGDFKIILSLTKNEGNNYSSSIRVKDSKDSMDIVKNESQTQKKHNATSKRVGETENKTDTKGPSERLKAKYNKRKYTSCKDDPTTALNSMLSSPEYLPDVGIDVTEKLKNMNSKDFETTLKNELQRIIDKQDGELTSRVETRLTGVAVSHDSYSEELRKKASRTKQKLDSMKTSKHKVTSFRAGPKQKSRALYKIEKSCKETILNRVYLKRVAKRHPDDEALCRKLSQVMTDSSNDESDGEAGVNRTKNKVASKATYNPGTGSGRSHSINSAKSASVDQPSTHQTEKKIRSTSRGKKESSEPPLGSEPGNTQNSNHSDEDSCSNLINILISSSSDSYSSSPCLFDSEKQDGKSVKLTETFGEIVHQDLDNASKTSSGVNEVQSDVSLQKVDETNLDSNCLLEESGNDRAAADSSLASGETVTDETLIDCQPSTASECLAAPIQESVDIIADQNDRNSALNLDDDDMISPDVRDDGLNKIQWDKCFSGEQSCLSESNGGMAREETTIEQSVDPTETAVDQTNDMEASTYESSDHTNEPTFAEYDRTVGNSNASDNMNQENSGDVEQEIINELGTSEKSKIEENANDSNEVTHTEFGSSNQKIVDETNSGERTMSNEDDLLSSNIEVTEGQQYSMKDEDKRESGEFAVLNQKPICSPNESSKMVSGDVSQENSSSAISDTCVNTIGDEDKNLVTAVDHDKFNKKETDEWDHFEKQIGLAQPSNDVSENEMGIIQPPTCSTPATNEDREENSTNIRTELTKDQNQAQGDGIHDHRVHFDESGSSDESRIIVRNIDDILDKLEFETDLNRQAYSNHDSSNKNGNEHSFQAENNTSQTSPGIYNPTTNDCDIRLEEQLTSTELISTASTGNNTENYANDLRNNASPSESISSSTFIQESAPSNYGDQNDNTEDQENAIRSDQTTSVSLDIPSGDAELLQGSSHGQYTENTTSLQSSASERQYTKPYSVVAHSSTVPEIDVTARIKRRRESIDFSAKKRKAPKIVGDKGEQESVPPVSTSSPSMVTSRTPNCARLSVELPGFNWLEEKIRLSSPDEVPNKTTIKDAKKKPFARVKADKPKVSKESSISSISTLDKVSPDTTAPSGSCNPQTFSSHESTISTAQNPTKCHQEPTTSATATTVAISILSPAGVVVVQHETPSLQETTPISSNNTKTTPGYTTNSARGAPIASLPPPSTVSPILWDILATSETPRTQPKNLNVSTHGLCTSTTDTSTTNTSQAVVGVSSDPWVGEAPYTKDTPGQPRYVGLVELLQQPPGDSRALCRVPHLQAAVPPAGPSSSQRCRAVPKKTPVTPILIKAAQHPQKFPPPELYRLQVRYPQTPSKPQQAAYSQQQGPFVHQQPQFQPQVQYPLYSAQQPQYHRQGHYPQPGYHQHSQYPPQGNPPYKVSHPHPTAYSSQQSQYYYQDQMGRKHPHPQQPPDVGHPSQYMAHAQLPHNNQNPEFPLSPKSAHSSRLNTLENKSVENNQAQLRAQQAPTGRPILQSSPNQESVQIVHPKPTQNVHQAPHPQMTQIHHQTLHPHQLPAAQQYMHPQQEQVAHRPQIPQTSPYSRDAPTVQHPSNAQRMPQKPPNPVNLRPETANQHPNIEDPQSVHQKNIQTNLVQQQLQALQYSQQSSASQFASQQSANLQNTIQQLSNNQQLQGQQHKVQPPQPSNVQGSLPPNLTSQESSSRSCMYSDITKPKSSFTDLALNRCTSSISTGTPYFRQNKEIMKPSTDGNANDGQKIETRPLHQISNSQGKNDNEPQRKENHVSRPDPQNNQTTSRFKEVTDRYFVQMIQEKLQQDPRAITRVENPINKVPQTQPYFHPIKRGQSTSQESFVEQPSAILSHAEHSENCPPPLQTFKFQVERETQGSTKKSLPELRRLKKFVYSANNEGQRLVVHDAEIEEDPKEMGTPLTQEEQNQALVTAAASPCSSGASLLGGCSSNHSAVIGQPLQTVTSNHREVEGTSSRNPIQKDRPAATNQLRKMLQLFRDKLGKTMSSQSSAGANKAELEAMDPSTEGNKPQSVEKELLRILENLTEASEKLRKQHSASQNLEQIEKHCDSRSSTVNTENTRFLIHQRIKEIKERITNTIVSELGKTAADDFQSTMNRTYSLAGEEDRTKANTIEPIVKESTSQGFMEIPDNEKPIHSALQIGQKTTEVDQNIKEDISMATDVKSKAHLSETVANTVNKMKSEDKNVLRIVRQKDEAEQWKCEPKEENSNKYVSGSKMLFNETNRAFMDRISSCGEFSKAKNPFALHSQTHSGMHYSSDSTANSPDLLRIETSNSELSSEEKISRGTSPTDHLGAPNSRLAIDTNNTSMDSNSMKSSLSSSSKSVNTEPSTTANVKDFYGSSKKKMASQRINVNLNESKDANSPAEKNKEIESNQVDAKSSNANIFAADNETLGNNSLKANDNNGKLGNIDTTTANLEDSKPASKPVEGEGKTSVGKVKAQTSVKIKKPTGNKSDRKVCGPKSRTRKKSTTEIDLLREELERTRKEVEELRMRQDRMFKEKMEAEQQKFDSHENSDARNTSEASQMPTTLNNYETLTEKDQFINTGTEMVSTTAVKNVPPEPDDSVKSSGKAHKTEQETYEADDKSSTEIQPSENISMATERAVNAIISNELSKDESSNQQQPDAFKIFTHDTSKTRNDNSNVDASSNCHAPQNNHSEQFRSRSLGSLPDWQNDSDQLDLNNSFKHSNVDEIKSTKAVQREPYFKKSQTDFEQLRRLNPDLEILRVDDPSVASNDYEGNKNDIYECASITLVDPRSSDSRVPPKKRTKMMWDGGSMAVSSGSSSPVVNTSEGVNKHGSLSMHEIIPIHSPNSMNSRRNSTTIPHSTASSSFSKRQISDPSDRSDAKDHHFLPPERKIQPDESSRLMEHSSENRQKTVESYSRATGTIRQDQYRQIEPNQHFQNMSENMEVENRQKSFQAGLEMMYQQPPRQSVKRKAKTGPGIIASRDSSASSQCQQSHPEVRKRAASTSRKQSADYSKSEQRPSSEPKSSFAPSPSGYPRPTQGPSSDPYSFHSTFKSNEDQRSRDLDATRSVIHDQRHSSAFNRPSDSSSCQGVAFVQPEIANSPSASYHHNSIVSNNSARDSPIEIVCANLQNQKRKSTDGDTNSASKEHKQIHHTFGKFSDTNIKVQSENSRVPKGKTIIEKSQPILPVPSRPSLPFDEQRSYPLLPTKPIVLRHPLPVQPKALHPLRTNQNPFHSNSPFVSNTIGNVSNLGHSLSGAAFNQLPKSPSTGLSQHESGLPTSVGTSAGSSTNHLNHSYTASSFIPQQPKSGSRSLRTNEAESSTKPQTYPNSSAHPHSATLAQLAHEQELSALYHQHMSSSRYPVPGYQQPQQQQQQQSSEEPASNKKIGESQQKDWRILQNLQSQLFQRQTQQPDNRLNMPNILQNQVTPKPQSYATSNQQLQNQYMQELLNKQKQLDSDKAQYEQYRLYQAFQQQKTIDSVNRQKPMFSSPPEKRYHENLRLGFQAPAVAGNPGNDSQSMPLNLQKHNPDRERNATFPNQQYSANTSNASQTGGVPTSAANQQSYSKPSQIHPTNPATYQAPRTTTAQGSPSMSVVSPSSTRSSGRSNDSGVSSVSSAGNETASNSNTQTKTRNVNDASARTRAREVTQRNFPLPILCCVCGQTATIRCPQCKRTEYCAEPCRFNHWLTHSKECLEKGGAAITMHRKNKDVAYT